MNNNYKEKLQDILNPIFFNDLRKTIRSKFFWFNMFFLLFVYCVTFFLLIFGTSFRSSEFQINCYRVLAFIFLIAYVAIPLELRKSSLNEASNDNIFFIFMSNITASKLINGKLFLGIFYNILLLISVIPFYFFILLTKGADIVHLVRVFVYTFIAPLPNFLFLIYEGFNDGRNKKAAHFINGVGHFIGLLIYGYMLVSLGLVEGIFKIDNASVVLLFFIDFAIFLLILMISLLIYLFIYSVLTKIYPMSEISSDFASKVRKGFSFKRNNNEVLKNALRENSDSNTLNNVAIEKKADLVNGENQNKVGISSPNPNTNTNINSKIKTTITTNKTKSKPLSSSIDTSPELKVYQSFKNKINIHKKEKIGSETIIKILLTGLFVLCLCVVAIKSMFGRILIGFSYYLIAIIAAYVHSRDKTYDSRSKLEIPPFGLKRILKFPFVSGYVNGIVWFSIICFIYVSVLFFTYGLYDKGTGRSYYIIDTFPGGYSVLIGFMLNIYGWSFIGRFIYDNFLNDDSRENKAFQVILVLMFTLSLLSGLCPKDPDSLNLFNYIFPSMPLMIRYTFFKKELALFCNFSFFIIAILFQIKPMFKQMISYFNHVSDFDEDD